MGRMRGAHEDVRDALIAFVLEMVFGQPERVEADLVQLPRDRIGLGENGRERLVRVAPLIGGSRVAPAVGQVDMSRIDGGELADHANLLGGAGTPFAPNRQAAEPGGQGGIRTLGTPVDVRRISNPLV